MRASAKVKVKEDTREEIYHIVHALPEEEIPAVRRFVQYVRDMGSDPMLRALANAPIDDEPETPEEIAAVKVARKELARGEFVTIDVAKRQLKGRR